MKARLGLGKRDRPSHLHPRTARSGEGDARVKAGGANGKHLGGQNASELITGRRTPDGSIRSDKAIRPGAMAFFRPR